MFAAQRREGDGGLTSWVLGAGGAVGGARPVEGRAQTNGLTGRERRFWPASAH
jgi:hypothetical protein